MNIEFHRNPPVIWTFMYKNSICFFDYTDDEYKKQVYYTWV